MNLNNNLCQFGISEHLKLEIPVFSVRVLLVIYRSFSHVIFAFNTIRYLKQS
jgi:hypothetical protein